MARPVLYVLAGVNGAGKSSIGGYLLTQAGLAWFNPDTFARDLKAGMDCSQAEANAAAWNEGVRRLDHAILTGRSFAFETTLGGDTITAKILSATRSHDVMIWFCGLPPRSSTSLVSRPGQQWAVTTFPRQKYANAA